MTTTAIELAQARDNLAALLSELKLAGHRYELTPDGEDWSVELECDAPDGWLSVALRLSRRDLREAAKDADARRRLLTQLDSRVAGCRREA